MVISLLHGYLSSIKIKKKIKIKNSGDFWVDLDWAMNGWALPCSKYP